MTYGLTKQTVSIPPFSLGTLSRLQVVAVFCLFEAVFFFSFKYAMAFSQAVPAPFWFPDAVLVFALLITPPRHWWLYFIGWLPIRLFVEITPGFPTWFRVANFVN